MRISTSFKNGRLNPASENPAVDTCGREPSSPVQIGLVSALAAALETAAVRYCHWKSNEALALASNGEIELDLLVGRGDVRKFVEILSRLNFKEARPNHARETPGVVDYYGMDQASQRVVHVHSHYQLVLGDDTTRNIRLPVEEPYLDSTVLGDVLRIPSPEFEFIVFVIRMILKHSTWDAIVSRRGSLSKSERRELDSLESRADGNAVDTILQAHLPFLADGTFVRCSQALHRGCSPRKRMSAGRDLQRSLAAYGRRPSAIDTTLKLSRRGRWWIERHVLKQFARKRLVSGGALIAVVGGDGSGKSSAVEELCDWLSRYFLVDKVHLGKPPWSLTTTAVKGTMVAGRRLGLFSSTKVRPYLTTESIDPARASSRTWLLWHALTARDRHRAYIRARRFASNGGLVVCDRYPLRQIGLMDGPASGWLPPTDLNLIEQHLVDFENQYYKDIKDPDVLIVLKIDPDIAVRRKREEDPNFVRARCSEIANIRWEDTRALVIDAHRPKDEVLAEVKSVVWSWL